jgi:hypothetical protein
MRHAPVVAVGLALLASLGVWLALDQHTDADLPAPTAATGDTVAPPAPPPAVERQPLPDAAHQPAAPIAADPPPAARSEPTATTANVRLRVRTAATHADVPAFHWRYRAGEVLLRGEGTLGQAALRLPPHGAGQLLVEAPDCEPFATTITAPADAEPPATVDVFLDAAAPAAGITLLVHDVALQPIGNIRVDAFPLPSGAAPDAWHLGAPLWARRAAAADGRYQLPGLMPGEYGIRVLATDATGTVLPLLPYLHTFVLTGASGYLEDVVLEPACVVEFELVDASGHGLDPAVVGQVDLRLHAPGGDPVARTWTVTAGTQTTTARDRLPAAGIVAPVQPVAAGTYVFAVAIGGSERVQQYVTLPAGARHRERIVVP